jgi:hypothetical protein
MTKKKKTSRKVPKTSYAVKEWVWPPDAQKNGKQWPKEDRKLWIKHLFGLGILDPKRQDLAEKFGISRRRLYDDFKEVYAEGLDPDEVQHTKVQMGNALKNAVIEAATMVTRGKGKEKLQAITTLGGITEKYTEFLEKFDIKQPGAVDDRDIMIRWDFPELPKKK